MEQLNSSSRYRAESLLSCLTLLKSPDEHIDSISERVSRSRAELERHVTIDFTFPENDLASISVETSRDEQALLFPVLTPRKGHLVTIDNITANGRALSRLSHREHVRSSRLMLSERLWATAIPWMMGDSRKAIAELLRIQSQLYQVVDTTPRKAREVLATIFDGSGMVKTFKGPMRPQDERRLNLLAYLLADRYIVLIEMSGKLGERYSISYRYRQPYVDERTRQRDSLKEFLGGHVPAFRFPVPLARRTNDYHFYTSAPSKQYFAEQTAQTAPSYDESGREIATSQLVNFSEASPSERSVAVEFGALSEAHIYIANGASSVDRLDVVGRMNELPLGSVGGAWVAAMTTFSLVCLLLFVRATTGMEAAGSVAGSDVPALLVALVASGVSLAQPMFNSGESVRVALLSRVTYVACGLLGNAFAVWWLLDGAEIDKPRSSWGRVASFAQDYAGIGLAAVLGIVVVLVSWRVKAVVAAYRKALRRRG